MGLSWGGDLGKKMFEKRVHKCFTVRLETARRRCQDRNKNVHRETQEKRLGVMEKCGECGGHDTVLQETAQHKSKLKTQSTKQKESDNVVDNVDDNNENDDDDDDVFDDDVDDEVVWKLL